MLTLESQANQCTTEMSFGVVAEVQIVVDAVLIRSVSASDTMGYAGTGWSEVNDIKKLCISLSTVIPRCLGYIICVNKLFCINCKSN